MDNENKQQGSSWKQKKKSARVLLRSVSLFIASGHRISASKYPYKGNDFYHQNSSVNKNKNMTPDSAATNTSSVGIVARHRSSSSVIDTLKRQTHFTKDEIEKLCVLFRKLVISGDASMKYHGSTSSKSFFHLPHGENLANKGLDRNVFRELLHNTFHILTEDILMDRIFCAFDRYCDSVINIDEWVLGLSVFLRGTLEEKISFSFFVYDLNSDGVITKEEIFTLLRNSLVKMPQDEDPDENVKDLAEIVLRKLDIDKDNKVSFQDFRKAVLRDSLLLEALGQCLPTDEVGKQFLANLQPK